MLYAIQFKIDLKTVTLFDIYISNYCIFMFGIVYKYCIVKTGGRIRGREKGEGNIKINREPLRGA
jgi:hypothetical protein